MSCTNLRWSSNIRYISVNSGRIPENGGVYKVLRDDGEEGKLARVYVGKAIDLRAQYTRHLSDYEENTCLRRNLNNEECYFKYALLSGEENRQNAETHLLNTGKYECNAQGQ